LGASVLGKRSVRADGKATITIPDGFGGPLADSIQIDVQGEDIQLEVDLPPIWRFGVQYSMPALFSVEAGLAHEAWKVHDQIVVRPQNINVGIVGPTGALPSQPLAPITQMRAFESTTAFRFGGELHLLEPYLGAAAGYYFEPSAVPDTSMDPSTPDWDKHAVSFGLNTTWLGLRLDVSVQHVFMASRTITSSQRVSVGPLEGGVATDDYLTRIGNGTYEGSYTLIGASLGASLDAMLGL
jgi:long-chain fatty acid transport protein